MASTPHESLKSAAAAQLLIFLLFTLQFSAIPTNALNIGLQLDPGVKLKKECSSTCESTFCGVAPFLRYGKYCGLLYSGCPGEAPCDGLDACCMAHDKCIQSKNNDYLSQECNQNLLNCVNGFYKSGARTFKGNTCSVDEVVFLMRKVIGAAILAGRILHHKQDGV
ncbi:unnamed protein product [Coffea canephora]|uniref:phospholipase A2 n=2 Tax=Coffea TaxID=13442 RepID=A0A068V6F6_COFCA|nr:phospholipase A2-alpha-like [Coffea arabica]CDP16114.1 unnamed protein product [Coffea canephora]